MRVAIASIFRNSTSYLQRYTDQLSVLTGTLIGMGNDVHLIMAEGDSTDDTWAMLQERLSFLFDFIHNVSPQSRLTLFQAPHGGPEFGSVDNEQRWRNISYVCNRVLEQVTPQDDRFLYVESDLIWNYDTMMALLDGLDNYQQGTRVDVVAPLCIHKPTGLFYDTWGYRKNGQQFCQHSPYHPEVVSDLLTPIDSAGSCLAMHGLVARECCFTPPQLGIVGFGNDIRAHGYSFFLDPSLTVYHP